MAQNRESGYIGETKLLGLIASDISSSKDSFSVISVYVLAQTLNNGEMDEKLVPRIEYFAQKNKLDVKQVKDELAFRFSRKLGGGD